MIGSPSNVCFSESLCKVETLNSEISQKIVQFFSLLLSPHPPSHHGRCTFIDSSRHSVPVFSLPVRLYIVQGGGIDVIDPEFRQDLFRIMFAQPATIKAYFPATESRDTLVTEVSLLSREPNLRFERISISRRFLWKSFSSFPFCTRHDCRRGLIMHYGL